MPEGIPLSAATAVRYAALSEGADWGAKVNAALAEFGANPGEVWVTREAGVTAPASNITLGAGHVLRFVQPGTYALGSARIRLSTGSGIISDYANNGASSGQLQLTYSGNGSAIEPVLPASLTSGVILRGFVLVGTAAGAIGIDAVNQRDWLIEDVSVRDFTAGTGLRVRSTAGGAHYIRMNRAYFRNNLTNMLVTADALGNRSNRGTVIDTHFDGGTYGLQMDYGDTWRFVACDWSDHTNTACLMNAGADDNVFIAPVMENAGGIGTGFHFALGSDNNRLVGAFINGFATRINDLGTNNTAWAETAAPSGIVVDEDGWLSVAGGPWHKQVTTVLPNGYTRVATVQLVGGVEREVGHSDYPPS